MKKVIKIVAIVLPILLALGVGIYYVLKLPNSFKMDRYNELVASADTHFEQKEYSKAINGYTQAVEMVNTKKEAFLGITKILLLKNQLSQTAELVEQSSGKLDLASQSELYQILADAYLDIGDVDKGLQYANKSLSLNGSSELAKLVSAKARLMNGSQSEVSSILNIQASSPNYEKAYILKLISAYNNMGTIKSLLEENVVVEDEGNKDIVADFQTVSKQNVADTIYISALLSRIYINNGYQKLAIALLEPMKEEISEYPDGLFFLARAYYDIGSYTSCISVLKDFPNSNSRYDVYLLLARSSVKTDDDSGAVKYYKSAIASAGDNSKSIYREYIQYLIEQKQYTQAGDVLKEVAKKYTDAWVDFEYIEYYKAQENTAKVGFYVNKISQRKNLSDSDKKKYLIEASLYNIDAQKYEEASSLLVQLKEMDEYGPWYYYLYGKMLLETGNTSEAKENLEKSIDYDLDGDISQIAKELLNRVN